MSVTINGTTGSISLALPPGMVMYFANSTAPGGWLQCNGAAVSRVTYEDLFDAIGTVYGSGDGVTTFNLPDLRGEFIRAWDAGRGVDPGRAIGSAQNDQMQAHQHGGSVIISTAGNSSAGGATYLAITGSGAMGDPTTSTGGTPRIGSETRPRNVAMMACIKF